MQFGEFSAFLQRQQLGSWICTGFRKQIEYVQSCSKDAAIIVIGPSDMAQYKEGIYSTFSFLPYC